MAVGPPPRKPPGGPAWIVQSFDGDSIRSSAVTIASKILPNVPRNHFKYNQTVVVCSACVEPDVYASCQLMQLLRSQAGFKVKQDRVRKSYAAIAAEAPPKSVLSAPADLFLLEYTNIASNLGIDSGLFTSLEREIERNCAWLRWLLCTSYIQNSERWARQLEDIIIAMSERLSSLMINYAILNEGFQTEIILAEDIEASIQSSSTSTNSVDAFAEALTERVKAVWPRIPIVTGRLSFETLPRFYTHQSSSAGFGFGFAEPLSILLSIGLESPEFLIWRKKGGEEGILTSETRRVALEFGDDSKASSISHSPIIRAKERQTQTASSTPKTQFAPAAPTRTPVLPTIKPLRVVSRRSMPNLSHQGPAQSVSACSPSSPVSHIIDYIFTITIAAKPHPSASPTSQLYFSKQVFAVLERHDVHPEIMNCTGTQITLAFEVGRFRSRIESVIDDLGQCGPVRVKYGMSILTLNLMDAPASASDPSASMTLSNATHIVSVLAHGGVRVAMIGPSTSSTMLLACAIEERDVSKALRLVKQTLPKQVRRTSNESHMRMRSHPKMERKVHVELTGSVGPRRRMV